MSNTLIQIKRSTTTQTPPNGSLSAGELAYSYLSDKLFAGNSSGTGVIEIGGKYYVDLTVAAFDKVNSVATSANAYASAVGTSANAYAAVVGTSANAYTNLVGASGNAYTVAVGTSGNAYAVAIGTSANGYAVEVGAASNAWANSVVSGTGEYANSTFVKLVSPNQTITGNLAITGSLTVAGNAYSIDTESLRISDPLIYLAGNNYTSDIVDIGFVANYSNGTSNLHTGFFRDATTKEYYVFQGYDQEPNPNHIDTTGNNFTLAVLNADIRTSNIFISGANAESWIRASYINANAAYDKANSANVLAYNTGIGANAYAESIVGPAFDKANGAVQTGFVTITANGTSIVADSNNDTLTITTGNGISIVGNATTDTINFGLTATGVTAASYGGPATVGTFIVDQFGRLTSASNAAIAISADAVTSGILPVPRGGTGVNTFTTNGILYGNSAGSLNVTGAGTEGQVLQASSSGVPQFGMLDGGSF